MTTQYTPQLQLPYWQQGDKNWHVQYALACGILDSMEALFNLLVVPAEAAVTPGSASASLNIAVFAGSARLSTGAILDYAGSASFAMTASTTNYVWLTEAGTLTKGTSWPASTFIVRLATVVAGTSTITSITPARVPTTSGGGTSPYLPLGGGTFTDASAVVTVGLGTTHGVTFGAGTTDKLGFYNATPVAQQANTVDLVVVLSTLGLRATGGNPPLNLGSGAITCGALNIGGTVTVTDAQNVAVGTTTGTKIGTATSQKLGFWNATPVTQPNTTGTTTGFTAGAGTAVDSAATFTGNTGTTAYTIGDIVKNLKAAGILAS